MTVLVILVVLTLLTALAKTPFGRRFEDHFKAKNAVLRAEQERRDAEG